MRFLTRPTLPMKSLSRLGWILLAVFTPVLADTIPVKVEPVLAAHGMVVAGHPEAAALGVAALQAGGNAMDAAVAVSLALGVAEPYGSGLGGKLLLLYYDAHSGQVYAVDGMDEASGRLKPETYKKLKEKARTDGWTAVCTPGLPAALHEAHQRWGRRPWADNIKPVVTLAREGSLVLPKTREFFEERLDKLQSGDADLARLYLPKGALPVAGSRLANPDLADTLEQYAAHGADGFYRGPVAAQLVAAAEKGGGLLTSADLAAYRARVTAPLAITYRGFRIVGSPPPTTGPALYMTILKALEPEPLTPPLRSIDNIDLIGKVWRVAQPAVQRAIGDDPAARGEFELLTNPAGVARLRNQAFGLTVETGKKTAWLQEAEPLHGSTTHFAIADAEGNLVCATQSLSLHFGAGVVAAGVVMNDSMSNFAFTETRSPNYIAPGKRPRSTIAPTLVFLRERPVLAIGIPGSARIPTAVLQGLLDYMNFKRPLAEAIGDTRLHWYNPFDQTKPDAVEAENSLPAPVVAGLRARGWDVRLAEAPGVGRHFGGLNAIEILPDGTRVGYADPRRTNAAAGY